LQLVIKTSGAAKLQQQQLQLMLIIWLHCASNSSNKSSNNEQCNEQL